VAADANSNEANYIKEKFRFYFLGFSKEVLLPGEPFWNSLLSFSYKPPITK
jgi:hypothetical protein